MNSGAPYEVYYSPGAQRDLRRLAADVLHRLDPRIIALAQDPRPRGCKKLEGPGNIYRVRAGDYRIVYEIDDGQRRVTLTIVANRRDVYRGL